MKETTSSNKQSISISDSTEDWYKEYYKEKGIYRNSLLRNSEVMFQSLALDKAEINAINHTNVDPKTCYVLDIGCGGGGSLHNFFRIGFSPSHFFGIDILDKRIKEAEKRFPQAKFACGDASNMQFEDSFFDIVTESTMFIQLTDSELSLKIAKEMVRVTKPGGYIILKDWRYSSPKNIKYKALTKRRIKNIFLVPNGGQVRVVAVFNGPLVPPIGRPVSKRVPFLYFLIQSVFPFLVGLKVTVLKKEK